MSMDSDDLKQTLDCTECKHLEIVEDRSLDYPPMGYCTKKHEIKHVDIMEWVPEKECADYEEGEPDFV